MGPRGGMGVFEKRKMYARPDLKKVVLYSGLPWTEQFGLLTPVGGGPNFPYPSRPALGPTHSPLLGTGVKRPGRGVDHLSH